MIKKKIKPPKQKPKFHCIYCDEIFEAQRKQAVYCSNTCRQYFHYFRTQLPNSYQSKAQISTYNMQFMPVYLGTNYSIQLHTTFATYDGIKTRNWIQLKRAEKEAEIILKSIS